MRYGVVNPWYGVVYRINCRIGNAHKAKDWPLVNYYIAVLDFIDPPQAEYARRYHHQLSRLL